MEKTGELEFSAEDVREKLEVMAALGLLETTRDSSGRVLYSLNNSPAAQVRMERFLARGGNVSD